MFIIEKVYLTIGMTNSLLLLSIKSKEIQHKVQEQDVISWKDLFVNKIVAIADLPF